MASYRIAEFARLAGITVRTLHYYDHIGLLKPSQMTAVGHRLYHYSDLIRLQQILTLKWMGFGLSEIKTMLERPDYDLPSAFAIQKNAVDRQIASLQAVSEALNRAQELADESTLQLIIQGLSKLDGMDEYYSEAAQLGIQTRRWAYTPEEMDGFQSAWQAVYAGFAENLDQPPDHPQVQALAAEMERLIQLFTGGDSETEVGLWRFHQALPEHPEHEQAYAFQAQISPELRQFIQTAYNLYLEKKTA